MRDRFFENDNLFETTSRESKKLFSELENVFEKILSNGGHLSLTNFDKNDENQIMCNLKLDSMPDTANEIDLEELISRSARRFRRAGLAIEPDSIQVFSNEEFLASYEEDAEATIIIEETNLDSSISDSQPEFDDDNRNVNSENSNEQDGAIVPELEIFTSTQPVTTSTSTSKIVIVEIPVDYSDPASEILESEYDFRYQEENIADIEDIELIEETEDMNPEDDQTEVENDGDSDEEASPDFSSDTDEIFVEIDDFEEIEDRNPDVFSETEEIIFYDPSEVFDSSSTASSSSDIDNSERATDETIFLSEIIDENVDEEGVIFETNLEETVDDNVETGVTNENGDESEPKTISASDKETKKSEDPQTGAVSDDNDSTSMVLWAIILLIALVIIVG